MWHAWVIGGAGAKLPFESGVITDLINHAEGYPNYGVGCSAGALCIAATAHRGALGLVDMWQRIQKRSDVFADRFDFWNKEFWKGKWSSAPLKKLIEEVVHSAPAGFPYGAVYSDLANMHARTANIDEQDEPSDMIDYILASASIPAVVPPVGDVFFDGGVFDIAPLKPAIDRAPATGGRITLILGSNLNPYYDVDWKPKTAIDIVMRTVQAVTDDKVRDDVATCLHFNKLSGKKPIELRIIQPPADWEMGSLDFDPKKMQHAYELGLHWRDYQPDQWVTSI